MFAEINNSMANDPAFLFYPGDYLRDTQCLSEAVQVAYDRIMCEHMRNICIRQQQLNFFTKKLSPEEVEELKMVLTEIDGGFQITWVAQSISKRRSYSQSRRENRSGKSKKDMINTSKSYDKHMDNENENENINSSLMKKESNTPIVNSTREKKEILDLAVALPDYVQEFIVYRKEIKKPFKTAVSIKKWCAQLKRLSNNDELVARRICDVSVANGWQGIFEERGAKTTDSRVTVDEAHRRIVSGETVAKKEPVWINPKQLT